MHRMCGKQCVKHLTHHFVEKERKMKIKLCKLLIEQKLWASKFA